MAEAAKKRKAKGEGSYKYNPDGTVTLRKTEVRIKRMETAIISL